MEYDAFREQFGRDEIVLALIHPKDVFEITFLEKLKAFHQELEETVPHLDEVRSLVNVTSMRGEEGELIIEELMEDWPETEKKSLSSGNGCWTINFTGTFWSQKTGSTLR